MKIENYARMFWPALLASILLIPFALRRDHAPRPDRAENTLPLKTLTIISPHWEGIRREFSEAFSRWTELNCGHQTRIDWLDLGGTSDGVKYVRSEFERNPAGINVDIFFGGGIDPYIQFKKDKILERISIEHSIINRIPPTLHGVPVYDPGMEWFGACLGGFGIIYNTRVLEILGLPSPLSWQDLAKPEYFSWIGSGDPRSSGSVHMVYEIILQAYGWDQGWRIITAMAGNIRSFSRSGSDTPRDTALGETACGLAIDVYAWRQQAEAGPDLIGFVFPSGLTVINPDGIAVLKGAPEKELAAKFVSYVLSEEGQKLWILRAGTEGGPRRHDLTRMPVLPGFAAQFGDKAAIKTDPFQSPAGLQYDPAKGSTRWTILNDLIGACLIDTHPALKQAWKAVSIHPPDPEHLNELLEPLISEEECMELAESEWNVPERRTAVKAAWTTASIEKYNRISRKGQVQ